MQMRDYDSSNQLGCIFAILMVICLLDFCVVACVPMVFPGRRLASEATASYHRFVRFRPSLASAMFDRGRSFWRTNI